MKLDYITGVYFDAATASYYQDIYGKVPVTKEGQLIASARSAEGELNFLSINVVDRPKAVMTPEGYFVPEFTNELPF